VLIECGIEVPSEATLGDLQDLYSIIYDDGTSDAMVGLNGLLETIQFPKLGAETFHDELLDILSRFDFCDGTCFIADHSLMAWHHCQITILLTKLVTFQSKERDNELP
jgi:hypothetical protein